MTYQFIDNKYTKIYFSLIQKRKEDTLSKSEVYCETHHITPKSLGGSNETSNLVNLTPREHFIAHRLLTKMTTGLANRSMWWALHRTLFSGQMIHNSKDYERTRTQWSEWLKQNHHSKTIPNWNKKMSEMTKKDWEDNYEKRKHVSETFKRSHKERKETDADNYYENQRKNALKGSAAIQRKWKEDADWAKNEKIKMSEKMMGDNNPMFGRPRSKEQKARQSEAISRKRWVSNETETIYVDVDLLEDYMKMGYSMGRKFMKSKKEKP